MILHVARRFGPPRFPLSIRPVSGRSELRAAARGAARRSMLRGAGGTAALLLFVLTVACARPASASAPVYGYQVVAVHPHDGNAFTQGLIYRNGFLYESTGLFGESTLRKVDLVSGTVLFRHDLPATDFGEGLTALRDTLYQITWQNHVGYSYVEQDTFRLLASWPYAWEGWGLTDDGARLIATDGSSTVRFLDPKTRTVLSQITVQDAGQPVTSLNELEYIRGKIYANVLPTSRIAVIDAATGQVDAWLDLSGLADSVSYDPHAYALNGIAYDPFNNLLLVTGKWWPKLFEIDVAPLHTAGTGPASPPAPTAGFDLAPNPTAGRARVVFTRISGAADRPGSVVTLLDPAGRLVRVFRGPSGARSVDLDLDGLAAGAYYVRVTEGEVRGTRKLLLVR